jgi:hypothetical protein
MHQGIDAVGLGQLPRGLGIVAHLTGINHRHRHPGGHERGGQRGLEAGGAAHLGVEAEACALTQRCSVGSAVSLGIRSSIGCLRASARGPRRPSRTWRPRWRRAGGTSRRPRAPRRRGPAGRAPTVDLRTGSPRRSYRTRSRPWCGSTTGRNARTPTSRPAPGAFRSGGRRYRCPPPQSRSPRAGGLV